MIINKIKHPLSARFLPIYVWQIECFGYACSVIISYLEFVGRTHIDLVGLSMARFVGDLQPYVGKDAVAKAVKLLLSRKILNESKSTPGGYSLYALNYEALNEFIFSEFGCIDEPRTESKLESRTECKSEVRTEPKSEVRTEPKSESTNVYIKEDVRGINKKEVRSKANVNSLERVWNKRVSGIVTWTKEDIKQAEELEENGAEDEIMYAVTNIESAGNEALVGRVRREIYSMRQKVAAASTALKKLESNRLQAEDIVQQTNEERLAIKFISSLNTNDISEFAIAVVDLLPKAKHGQSSHKVKMVIISRQVPKGLGEKEFYSVLNRYVELREDKNNLIDDRRIDDDNLEANRSSE